MTNQFVMDLRASSQRSLTFWESQRSASWYIDLLKRRIDSLDHLIERREKTGLA